MSRAIDITNKTFGRLKVIRRVENHIKPGGGKVVIAKGEVSNIQINY